MAPNRREVSVRRLIQCPEKRDSSRIAHVEMKDVDVSILRRSLIGGSHAAGGRKIVRLSPFFEPGYLNLHQPSLFRIRFRDIYCLRCSVAIRAS